MMRLIDKSRELNRLLQKTAGQAVSFMEIAEVLTAVVYADAYVISRKGKLLGWSVTEPSSAAQQLQRDRRIASEDNSLLFSVKETVTSEDEQPGSSAIFERLHGVFGEGYMTLVPIIGGEQRIGTLLLCRTGRTFGEDDIIIAEYGATIVGMEIQRGHVDENESEARSKAAVQAAVGSLSFSELEAVEHIIEEMKGIEGLLVASKIADRVGITRSVIVNALRKLESAGVIETRSLGMKGTYIKILNDRLVPEITRSDLHSKI